MKVNNIVKEIEKRAPSYLQLEYDNSGLQAGDLSEPLRNILVTLDVCDEAINKAVKNSVNLIISHHPLIFKALKKIDKNENVGKKIIAAIKNDISIYSCHTNFDSAPDGLNEILGNLLGIKDMTPLVNHEESRMYKLVVFVPKENEQDIKDALFSAGAGVIGDYRNCSFSQTGVGSFFATSASSPHVGDKRKNNTVTEARVEVLLERRFIRDAVNKLFKAHPYEEPSYDIYPLVNFYNSAGLGRFGELKEASEVSAVAKMIKKSLNTDSLRIIGDEDKTVKKVAVCCGSGGSLINSALAKGADLYVTGDIKYHEAIYAMEEGLCVIDAGHFATEKIFVDDMKKFLSKIIKSKGLDIKVISYESKDPFKLI